jgi:hypothetical protein
MADADLGISPERRAGLARKGQLLYAKSCGANGKGTCAEGFALFHIGRGEAEIARDLLAFLESTIEALRGDDPEGRLASTEELAARIRRHLEREGDAPRAAGPTGARSSSATVRRRRS